MAPMARSLMKRLEGKRKDCLPLDRRPTLVGRHGLRLLAAYRVDAY